MQRSPFFEATTRAPKFDEGDEFLSGTSDDDADDSEYDDRRVPIDSNSSPPYVSPDLDVSLSLSRSLFSLAPFITSFDLALSWSPSLFLSCVLVRSPFLSLSVSIDLALSRSRVLLSVLNSGCVDTFAYIECVDPPSRRMDKQLKANGTQHLQLHRCLQVRMCIVHSPTPTGLTALQKPLQTGSTLTIAVPADVVCPMWPR